MTFPIRLIIYSVILWSRSTPCKILSYLFPKQNKIGVMVSIILNEYMDNNGWVIGKSCKIWTRKNIGYCILTKFYILIYQNVLFTSVMSWLFSYTCILLTLRYRMWNKALWNSFLFQDVIYVLTSAFNGALFIQRTKIVTLEWDSFPLFANKFWCVS